MRKRRIKMSVLIVRAGKLCSMFCYQKLVSVIHYNRKEGDVAVKETRQGAVKFYTPELHTLSTELSGSIISGFQLSCALAVETPQRVSAHCSSLTSGTLLPEHNYSTYR